MEEIHEKTALPSQHSLRPGTVAAILSAALAARLFVLCFVIVRFSAVWLYSRGMEMGFLARNLLTGHGLASPFGVDTGPTAFIAPGYPLLVAGIFRVFGIYSPSSAIVLMLLQIAASVLTVWLIMRLAARLFDARTAILAGLFWACWLPLLWIPTIFWETSFSACIMLALPIFAMRLRNQPTSLGWICFGVFCGAASLINMALLLTSIALFLWIAWYTWRRAGLNIVLAACLMVLVYSPWPVRNERVFHAFVPLRTTIGLELWMGNQDNAKGYLNETVFPMYNRHELDEYVQLGEIAYDRQKKTTAQAWIVSHPAAFARLTTLRFFRFWSGRGNLTGSFIYMVGALATTLGGFAGLFLLYKSGRRSLTVLLALPLLLFPLPYYITHAEFRYRLVLDPLLTVLAAHAAVRALAMMRSQKHNDAPAPAGSV